MKTIIILALLLAQGCATTQLQWGVRDGFEEQNNEPAIKSAHENCVKVFTFGSVIYQRCMFDHGYKLSQK